jgi:signal peptidase I
MIRGESMLPELHPNTKYPFMQTDSVAKDDFIVFRRRHLRDNFVKKVYAVPGDIIEYNNEKQSIEINNQLLKRFDGKLIPITKRQFIIISQALTEGWLKENHYLVFSTNLSTHYDSRMYGAIKRDDVVGILVSPIP